MGPPSLTRYGDRGLLIELAAQESVEEETAREVAGWAAAVRAAQLAGVVDVVPAARSVLVHCTDFAAVKDVRNSVASLQPLSQDTGSNADTVDIPVTYDGPDLRDVAEATGLGVADVVRAHQETPWRVAFAGFAPGFAYLVGGDARLAVPRRGTPRTRVPEGSVAVAAGYSAVYPRSSPGGWQLIGRTELAVWDVTRDPPALLVPGTRVRFVRADR